MRFLGGFEYWEGWLGGAGGRGWGKGREAEWGKKTTVCKGGGGRLNHWRDRHDFALVENFQSPEAKLSFQVFLKWGRPLIATISRGSETLQDIRSVLEYRTRQDEWCRGDDAFLEMGFTIHRPLWIERLNFDRAHAR